MSPHGLHKESIGKESTRTPQGFCKDSTRTFLSLVSRKKVVPRKESNSDLNRDYIINTHDQPL
jgi:hypothetical protein